MSGAAQGSSATTKAVVSDTKNGEQPLAQQDKKPAVQLEEDDEFEDFPRRRRLTTELDWTEEETQIPGGNAHLWEESWDDDDTNEDFAVQLREELKKLGK
ncbi:26S proteasome complex subunit [Neocucurbitaria cava]|uniref:26S proteasome complex subunit SEM1 n=1 Tax=Neocucurbitaria cava TaxID=798079 RepID=A0A9W8Y5V9_9PLEO|nr:26S proteasome complex subunit [Neocucurbitaria cava]